MVSALRETGNTTETYEENINSDSFCGVCVFTQDGRLAAGDQLLSVDGRSLVGLSQERYF